MRLLKKDVNVFTEQLTLVTTLRIIKTLRTTKLKTMLIKTRVYNLRIQKKHQLFKNLLIRFQSQLFRAYIIN